jgi:hypothetical protein
MSLVHDDHEVRIRNANVPMRGHRLQHQRFDEATEVLVDFYSRVAVSEFKVWTNTADRLRVRLGAGSYVAVGDSFDTAVDLGSFTAGETKAGTIEVTIPSGSGSRHEQLDLSIGLGV